MRIDFTAQELELLKKEFGLSKERIPTLTDDELLEIADECFDIELEGELQSGSTMPDRCGVAAGIVSKVNDMFD